MWEGKSYLQSCDRWDEDSDLLTPSWSPCRIHTASHCLVLRGCLKQTSPKPHTNLNCSICSTSTTRGLFHVWGYEEPHVDMGTNSHHQKLPTGQGPPEVTHGTEATRSYPRDRGQQGKHTTSWSLLSNSSGCPLSQHTYCDFMTFAKPINHSVPQFPHL